MRELPNRFELRAPGWRSGPVTLAGTRRARLAGLRQSRGGLGMLLAARSVHGFGLQVALWAVSLDQGGRVRGVSMLSPGGLLIDSAAVWFLELPLDVSPPAPGLQLAPMVASWRAP